MPENQEAQHWFVTLHGKRYGPYTFPALVKGVEKGVIDRGAGVWRPGWEEWRTAGDVPELFQLEPDAVEVTEEAEATEGTDATAEASATVPDESAETLAEQQEPEPAEPVAIVADAEDHGDAQDAADMDSTVAVSAATAPAAASPAPAAAGPEPTKAEVKETELRGERDAESPREVRESVRRNRFRDGPDLFGRGFARSDPVRLEPLRSDTAKSDIAKPDPARPEVGKLDLAKLDFGEMPRREGGARDPASRDLLARAIPNELGAPDIGSRNPPLTDAALRVRLNTMLASADLAAPRKEGESGAADAAQADAKKAMEPADPVATKPLVAVERLSDLSGPARSRKADIKPDNAKPDIAQQDITAVREVPKFPAEGPPVYAPAPVPEPKGGGRGIWPVILSVLATLIVVGAAAWAASAVGIIRVEFLPKQGALGRGGAALQSLPGASSAVRAHAMLDGLPDIVANMPAVIALKMADPDAYGKFVKRFTAIYLDNEPDDVILTQARTALRKSIKHLLANATNESLLEVTEVNLAYMRGLSLGNAGSCVALSDESKGAVLDSNLARDFPPLFEREMAVLERVISNAGAKQTAPTEAEVRPYLEAVFAGLKNKPVQMQLLGRDKLTETEYAPYCDLVIAFYEAVRALPFNDAVKLLRNLYAAAAAEPDKT
jgi:GYF domain 2